MTETAFTEVQLSVTVDEFEIGDVISIHPYSPISQMSEPETVIVLGHEFVHRAVRFEDGILASYDDATTSFSADGDRFKWTVTRKVPRDLLPEEKVGKAYTDLIADGATSAKIQAYFEAVQEMTRADLEKGSSK